MTRDQELSLLCSTCGLCCDGTLFTEVPITDGDADSLQLSGIEVEAPRLPQPCAALRGTCCSVYSVRPMMCRAFTCRLYRTVKTDEVRIEDALEIVAAARALKTEQPDKLETLLARHFVPEPFTFAKE